MGNFGWSKAFEVYPLKSWRKSCVWPLVYTMTLLPIFYFSDESALFFIDEITTQVITIVPNILGFLLGGYALLMGFSSDNIIKIMSKSNNNKATLYQKQNAVFAIALFALFVGLIISLFVSLILKAKIRIPYSYCQYFPIEMFNYVVLTLLCFILFYSIFAIKDMVINVFNFGQLVHYTINIKKKKAKKSRSKKNNTK